MCQTGGHTFVYSDLCVFTGYVQEAFTNTLKHGDAKRITLSTSVDYAKNRVLVSVADDGKGLAVASQHGRGIDNMKSRASKLGGELEIISIPGGGTCLNLYLPVNQLIHEADSLLPP